MRRSSVTLALLLTSLLPPGRLHAEEPTRSPHADSPSVLPRVPDQTPEQFGSDASPMADARGYFVLGVADLPPYMGARSESGSPFLISRVRLGPYDISLEGLDAYLDLAPSPIWRAGLTTSIEMARSDADGDDPIAGASELGAGAALGAFVGVEVPSELMQEGLASARVSLRSSNGAGREGSALTVDADWFFAATFMLRIGVAVKATLGDSQWMDSRYGLDEFNAGRTGLPAFQADAGLMSIGASAYSIVSLSPSTGLFARVGRTRLQGDAARSPLVVDATQRFVGIGAFYLF